MRRAIVETNPKMHLYICTPETESVKSHALQTLEESESKLQKPCNEVSRFNIIFILLQLNDIERTNFCHRERWKIYHSLPSFKNRLDTLWLVADVKNQL